VKVSGSSRMDSRSRFNKKGLGIPAVLMVLAALVLVVWQTGRSRDLVLHTY
jgi:hypothetical protein